MHTETLMFVLWMATPLIGYAGGHLAIRASRSHLGRRGAVDPADRLEELRRRQATGHRVVRGRMTEALLLAESASVVATSTRHS
ncbi:MAG: hypothetical protein ACTMHL_15555 [Janibacter sp.]